MKYRLGQIFTVQTGREQIGKCAACQNQKVTEEYGQGQAAADICHKGKDVDHKNGRHDRDNEGDCGQKKVFVAYSKINLCQKQGKAQQEQILCLHEKIVIGTVAFYACVDKADMQDDNDGKGNQHKRYNDQIRKGKLDLPSVSGGLDQSGKIQGKDQLEDHKNGQYDIEASHEGRTFCEKLSDNSDHGKQDAEEQLHFEGKAEFY